MGENAASKLVGLIFRRLMMSERVKNKIESKLMDSNFLTPQDYREVEAFRKRMLELNQDLFKEIFKEAFEMARFEHENIMKCEGISLDEKLNPEARFLKIISRQDLKFLKRKKRLSYHLWTKEML